MDLQIASIAYSQIVEYLTIMLNIQLLHIIFNKYIQDINSVLYTKINSLYSLICHATLRPVTFCFSDFMLINIIFLFLFLGPFTPRLDWFVYWVREMRLVVTHNLGLCPSMLTINNWQDVTILSLKSTRIRSNGPPHIRRWMPCNTWPTSCGRAY